MMPPASLKPIHVGHQPTSYKIRPPRNTQTEIAKFGLGIGKDA